MANFACIEIAIDFSVGSNCKFGIYQNRLFSLDSIQTHTKYKYLRLFTKPFHVFAIKLYRPIFGGFSFLFHMLNIAKIVAIEFK